MQNCAAVTDPTERVHKESHTSIEDAIVRNFSQSKYFGREFRPSVSTLFWRNYLKVAHVSSELRPVSKSMSKVPAFEPIKFGDKAKPKR